MRRCLNCMNEYSESCGETCPYCGFVDGVTQNGGVYLQPGSILQGRYIVGTVIKARDTDVFYIGWDALFERKVQIQEYFPKYCATRSGRPVISVYDSKQEVFLEGMELFYQQSRQLIRLYQEEDVVTCHACFQENGTVYAITEYRQEKTLNERLAGQVLRVREAETYFYAAARAVQKAHEMGIYHGQIGLDAFWVTAGEGLILKDFGASRYVSGEPGIVDYGRGGMNTDVYGLAKLFCRMVTGNEIQDEEKLEAELLRKGISLNRAMTAALKNALRHQTDTVEKFCQEFSGARKIIQRRGKKKKQGSLKLPRWMIVTAAAAAAGILVFTGLVATGVIHLRIQSGESQLEDGKVRMPNVVNMEADEAERLLSRRKLVMSREQMVYSKEIDADMVSYQSIKENTAVDQNTTVVVWISMGEEKAVIPAVMGMDEKEAQALLKAAGFTNVKTEESPAEGVLNAVVDISEEQGANVELSKAITLFICAKEKEVETDPDVQVAVPDVAGKTKEEAEALLKEIGFEVDWIEENSEQPEGIVLGQNPMAEESVNQGSVILVRVSKGEEKIYMKNVQLLTEEEAREVIEGLGLMVKNVEKDYSDSVAEGKVITQSIKQDAEVKKGDSVDLVISRGRKKNPVAETTTQSEIALPLAPEQPETTPAPLVVPDTVPTSIEESSAVPTESETSMAPTTEAISQESTVESMEPSTTVPPVPATTSPPSAPQVGGPGVPVTIIPSSGDAP